MMSDRDSLDEEFPLGDGTADLQAEVCCPYCGEIVEISLDPGSGSEQQYVEDCQVCCQPWRVSVQYRSSGAAEVTVEPEDTT
jgi:cysteine-rich CPXCG protein